MLEITTDRRREALTILPATRHTRRPGFRHRARAWLRLVGELLAEVPGHVFQIESGLLLGIGAGCALVAMIRSAFAGLPAELRLLWAIVTALSSLCLWVVWAEVARRREEQGLAEDVEREAQG